MDAVTAAVETANVVAAVSASVSIAVSAAIGASGGGAVSGLMGAQRLNMYGDLTASADIETVAAEAVQPDLMMCRLGFFSTSSARRRLITAPAASGRRLSAQDPQVNDFLLTMLGDSAFTLLLVVIALSFIHFFLLVYWRYRVRAPTHTPFLSCFLSSSIPRQVNAKFYAAARSGGKKGEKTPFTPLPGVFAFPNLELTLFMALVTGLMKNIFTVYGTYAGEYTLDSTLWTVTAVLSFLLFVVFSYYSYQLVLLRREGVTRVWKTAKGTETNDPAMQVLVKLTCGLVKPGPRHVQTLLWTLISLESSNEAFHVVRLAFPESAVPFQRLPGGLSSPHAQRRSARPFSSGCPSRLRLAPSLMPA